PLVGGRAGRPGADHRRRRRQPVGRLPALQRRRPRGALQRAGHADLAGQRLRRDRHRAAQQRGPADGHRRRERDRPAGHDRRRVLQGVEHAALRPPCDVPPRLPGELPRRGVPARARGPRPGVQPQLVHERARRGGRGAWHRRRSVGAGKAGRVPGGDGHPGDRLELPANEQPVQRLQPDPATHDRRGDSVSEGVLVANRGEIARRVIRTARRMGLRTVAVFSDADRAAPHVREADHAVRLGPAPARESYLRADAVLDAALAHGAGIIHPGYGFLSENAAFARAVEAAGLRFAGPTAEQIVAFGEKHTAKALAKAAGVPLLAGTELLASADEAVAAAEAIGLPVMVKATGGGGGIGMRACFSAGEVRDAFAAVEALAAQNFGSAGVFLERLVRPARHVEVQVFGDGAGRVAVLSDRDCSLQRRNQKVIEEAPAPALPGHVRELLHRSSHDLLAAVDYRGAGTVEFVYDPAREEAAFLEVNTRLQVEHPVTEQVLGVDLVELMLTLARDGRVEDAVFTRPWVPVGHAVEARVYAEDPAKESLPSSGLVTRAVFPGQGRPEIRDVRVDGFVETGLEVSPFYDPMLAKVIATAPSRTGALDLLGAALDAS